MKKSSLFLALDVDNKRQALELARQTKPFVEAFKIGPRLTMREGPSLIKDLAKMRDVFVDHKYFDIPSTMEAAVRAVYEAGATYVTVHAQAGSEALSRLAQLEKELNRNKPFHVLAVTVLTSFTQSTLPPNVRGQSIEEQVTQLAGLAVNSGVTGIVCAPYEVHLLRNQHPAAFLVTPGVRVAEDSPDDQKRIMTPKEALNQGASAVVAGRPICQAPDPAAVAKKWREHME